MAIPDHDKFKQSTSWWPWSHPNLRGEPSEVHAMPRGAAVFIPKPSLRPLVVLLDHHLCELAATNRTVAFLLELLAVPPIQTHLYANDGPPANAARLRQDPHDYAPGWAHLSPRPDRKIDVLWVRDGEPQVRLRSPDQMESRRIGWARFKESGDLGGILDEPDGRALLVAEAMQADLFITDRPNLLASGPEPWIRATVMTPEDALPNVGLYLRRQGLYVRRHRPRIGELPRTVEDSPEDASYFYWQAANSLLPYLSPWSHVCTDYDEQYGTDSFGLLAKGLPVRLGQVLRCRDRLLSLLARPPDIAVMDEALTELDQLLVWFMAAFDITARVANSVLGVGMAEHTIGWQREDWVRKVKQASPPLYAAATASKFKGVPAVVYVIGALRNMVHGPGLAAGGTIPAVGEHAFEIYGALPKAHARHIFEALGRVEGGVDWGVHEPLSGYGLHVQPGLFAERLLPYALSLVNELMRHTVLPADAATGRIALTTLGLISPSDARRLWQLGISPQCPISNF